jgi:hypothetical protein
VFQIDPVVTTPAAASINTAVDSLALAGLAGYFLKWMKDSPWVPWLDRTRTTMIRIAHFALAAVSAAGIHYTVQADVAAGSYVIAVNGATLLAMGHALVDIGKQWAFQRIVYDGVIDRGAQPQQAVIVPPTPQMVEAYAKEVATEAKP